MAKKAFEIQGSDLNLGGVVLQAGATAVVIPGVTQAVNYTVDEVDERDGDNPDTFGSDANAVTVIDHAEYLYQSGGTPSGSYVAATYSVDELDDGQIEEINVDTEGVFLSADVANIDRGNMWATTTPTPFASFNENDWTEIPFRPKMRAGEVESVGGGSGADTGDFVFSNNFLTAEGEGIDQVVIQGETDGDARIDIPNNDWAENSKALEIKNYAAQGVKVSTGSNGDNTWAFTNEGGLEFPDGTIQTTAYTGQSGGGSASSSNVWVALGDLISGDGTTILSSTDGINWTTGNELTGVNVNRVAIGNGKIVYLVGGNAPGVGDSIRYASNIDDSLTLAVGTDSYGEGFQIDWSEINYLGGKFVAVGSFNTDTTVVPASIVSITLTSGPRGVPVVTLDNTSFDFSYNQVVITGATNTELNGTWQTRYNDLLDTIGTGVYELYDWDTGLPAQITSTDVSGAAANTGDQYTFNLPLFAYSTDGVTWTYGNIDSTYLAEFGGNYPKLSMVDIAYDGTGYLIPVRDTAFSDRTDPEYDNGPGAFYITDLTAQAGQAQFIPGGDDIADGLPGSYNNIAGFADGAFFVSDDQYTVWTATDALNGPWTERDIRPNFSAAYGWTPDAGGNDNGDVDSAVAGTVGGEPMWVGTTNSGHAIWTTDNGSTFQFSIPSVLTSTSITAARADGSSPWLLNFDSSDTNAQQWEKIVIAVADGDDTSWNGTYYIDQVNPGEWQLYDGVEGNAINTTSWAALNNPLTVTHSQGEDLGAIHIADGACIVEGNGKMYRSTNMTSWTEVWDGSATYMGISDIYYGTQEGITTNQLVNGEQTLTLNPNGSVTFPDATVQTTAYTGVLPNTVKGWINLVGDRPNNEDAAWFESVVVHGEYAYVLGGDAYIDNSNDRSKVYKFDIATGEQVWVKQISAGRGATFDIVLNSGAAVITPATGGVGYKVGEKIVIRGDQIGGSAPLNNLVLVVGAVDGDNDITAVSLEVGYDLGTITGTFNDVYSQYEDAQGDACAIAYDEYNQKLVVVTQYNSGRGDVAVDSDWTWANVYTMNPSTGDIDATTTISEDGDIYPNSITTHNSAGGIAIVGEKYNEYREFGALTMSATYNGYFDILKTELDAEHYPGAPFNYYGDFWISGTGITGQTQVTNANYYENLSPTTREGSGATFDISVTPPSTLATITEADLATATATGTMVKNADNIVTPGGWGNWLVFPDSALRVTFETSFTPNQVVPVQWDIGGTSTTGFIMIQFPGDGTFQITPVEEGGGNAVAGTWYFDMSVVTPGSYSVAVQNGGTNYLAGHKITLLGLALGGTTPGNDIVITVDSQTGGAIDTISTVGTPNPLAASSYTAVSGTNTDVGSGVVYALSINPSTGTPGGPLTVYPYGTNYVAGDVLTISGTNFAGGTSPANDLTVTVGSVVNNGEIASTASLIGTGPTNIVRIFVSGIDFTAVGGAWSMRQNLGGEAFIWTPNWTNAIGGPSGDRFMDVCWEDAGTALYAVGRGVYEVAYTQALVVKYNATTGAVLWSKDIKFSEATDNNREARAVCLVPGSTDIIVAGAWYNPDINGGNNELILTRMTDMGIAVWQKTYSPNIDGNYFDLDWEISLKAGDSSIVVSFEQGTNEGRGLAYMIVDTNGVVVRHRVVSSDGNSNYNYHNTPTANFADIYTDENLDEYIVMAGKTYVPTDNYYNALLMKLPLDGLKEFNVNERWSIGEHIMNRHAIAVTTVTSAFDSFTPDEHVDTMTNTLNARNYRTITPDGELPVWTHKITDETAGYLEFGDGSKQSFATNIIPQIPAANDYWLTTQDSGKHIFFEHENGTVWIPHRLVRYFPVGFTVTIVNTSGSNCYVEHQSTPGTRGELKLAGRNISTYTIGIPDSGSGSMVTLMKIKDGYTMTNSDNDQDYADVWIVSGPGDVFNND